MKHLKVVLLSGSFIVMSGLTVWSVYEKKALEYENRYYHEKMEQLLGLCDEDTIDRFATEYLDVDSEFFDIVDYNRNL